MNKTSFFHLDDAFLDGQRHLQANRLKIIKVKIDKEGC